MPSSKNIETVRGLADKLRDSKSIVFMNYKGVSAPVDNELRKKLKSEQDLEYFVVKNRLFKIALKEAGVEVDLGDSLKGPTAFIVSYGEPTAATKVVASTFKDSSDAFVAKGGVFESRFVDAETVEAISKIPSREILLSQLLAAMQSPIQRLHTALDFNISQIARVLKSISEKK